MKLHINISSITSIQTSNDFGCTCNQHSLLNVKFNADIRFALGAPEIYFPYFSPVAEREREKEPKGENDIYLRAQMNI